MKVHVVVHSVYHAHQGHEGPQDLTIIGVYIRRATAKAAYDRAVAAAHADNRDEYAIVPGKLKDATL